MKANTVVMKMKLKEEKIEEEEVIISEDKIDLEEKEVIVGIEEDSEELENLGFKKA